VKGEKKGRKGRRKERRKGGKGEYEDGVGVAWGDFFSKSRGRQQTRAAVRVLWQPGTLKKKNGPAQPPPPPSFFHRKRCATSTRTQPALIHRKSPIIDELFHFS
jgi:hypothetical protein